jgi:hypothetical protein
MGVLGVSDVANLEVLGAGRSLNSTTNQDLTGRSNLEVVFQDLGVLADGVDPALMFIDRQGDVLEQHRVNGELSLLSNETSSNTQSTNTGGIIISDDPQLSFSRHLFNLLDELTLVSVEEAVEHNVGSEFLGKDGRRGEIPSNNDALASREMLNEDLVGGKGLEFGSKLLYAERDKPFFFRWGAG